MCTKFRNMARSWFSYSITFYPKVFYSSYTNTACQQKAFKIYLNELHFMLIFF